MKPGWKTSEFWLTVLGGVASAAGAVAQVVPVPAAMAVAGALVAVYTAARTAVKIANRKAPAPSLSAPPPSGPLNEGRP